MTASGCPWSTTRRIGSWSARLSKTDVLLTLAHGAGGPEVETQPSR